MDQDRAAQVWKGPWKCKECDNRFKHKPNGMHMRLKGCEKDGLHCDGPVVPYDRRNPT